VGRFSEDVGRRTAHTKAGRSQPISTSSSWFNCSFSNAHANRRLRSQSFTNQYLTPLETPKTRPTSADAIRTNVEAEFAQDVLEGSRFAIWQVYHSASKRLPRTFPSVIIALDSIHPLPKLNTRRDVPGSRLLQNTG